MNRNSLFAKIVFALAFTAVIIGFSAFSQQPEKSSGDSFRKDGYSKDNDTAPSGQRDRDGSSWRFDKLDRQMKQLDEQMKKLENQMRNLNLSKFERETDES